MIREATLADVPRLVEMGTAFLRSSAYAAVLPENPTVMAELATRLISQPDGVMFVVEQRSGLVGMLGLVTFRHPLSGAAVAGELVWWIEPTARGAGVRLLRHAEAWARADGRQFLQMISPNAHVSRFYAKMGYSHVETAWQKTL